jgi:glycosyltransferase involved in cell wall biosynthesis
MLSLTSFVDHGHQIELYSYDTSLPVPRGVRLRDASEVLPESRIFFYASGPGKGSVAGFANLFRYLLLRQKGGWWVDTDVLCLSPRLPALDRFFAWEGNDHVLIGNAVLKFPGNDALLQECLSDISVFRPDVPWGTTGPFLLTAIVKNRGLAEEAQHFLTAYPWHHSRWFEVFDPERTDVIRTATTGATFHHLWHEHFRRCGIIKLIRPPAGSYLDELFERHKVGFPTRRAYDYASLARLSDIYTNSILAKNDGVAKEQLPTTPSSTFRSAWLHSGRHAIRDHPEFDMTLPTRLIIADPGLIHAGGHHLSYSQAVAEASIACQIPAVILANRDFSTIGGMGAVRCVSTFRARYQTGGQPSALRSILYASASHLPRAVAPLVAQSLRAVRRTARRNLATPDTFGEELAAALAALGGTQRDLVLLHSVSAANLHGLTGALGRDAVGGLAVVLRRTPEEMDIADAAPQAVKTVLARLIAHFGDRLHLFADTEQLADLYRTLVSAPVATVPLPVMAPPIRRGPVAPLPHLVFAGGARAEKGYDLLPPLVDRLRGKVRLTVQSGPIGAGTDPSVQQVHRTLKHMSGPDLVLLERSLDPPAYMDLLASTDLMLLPYRADIYGPRSSGILAEARAMGVPAIVPRGTWMAEAAGASPCVLFDGPADFIAAVERTLRCLPELTVELREAAPSWRRTHCPEAVLHALLRPLADDPGQYSAGLVSIPGPLV